MSVQVRDVAALRDFRAALIQFAEEVAAVLNAARLELQRATSWIEQDRPLYWAGQTRRAFDDLARTRAALHTCQLRTVAGRHPACIEEQVAFERAQRRLHHCHEQSELVQQWHRRILHEADEFRGRLSPLQRVLDQDIPRMVALLDRLATVVDAYAADAYAADADAADADADTVTDPVSGDASSDAAAAPEVPTPREDSSA